MKNGDDLHRTRSCRAKRRSLRRLAISVYAVALIAFLSLAFLSNWEITTRNEQHELVRITVPYPLLPSATRATAASGALGLLAIAIISLCCRHIRFGIITILIALVGYPVSCITSFAANPAPWTTEAELVQPAGHTYYFMDSSFLQGQTMVIARLESRTLLTRTLQVLGTNNGDWPRSWASVIRPVGAPAADYGQLYVTDSGMLIGIRFDNKCYLAYDTISGRFYGHGPIEEISPFVLMGPNTVMHQPDVRALLETVRSGAEFLSTDSDIRIPAAYLGDKTVPGYPRSETLQAGLTHPNPAVREVAGSILDIHRAGLKKAQIRVQEHVQTLTAQLSSDDSSVRTRAASALGWIGAPGATPAIPALAVALKDEDSDVSMFASQTLSLIGEPAVPALIESLKDKSTKTRARAAAILGDIGPAARPAISALTALTEDKDSDVRRCAAQALKQINQTAESFDHRKRKYISVP